MASVRVAKHVLIDLSSCFSTSTCLTTIRRAMFYVNVEYRALNLLADKWFCFASQHTLLYTEAHIVDLSLIPISIALTEY